MSVDILVDDCRELLPCLPADTYDSVVTDPPYELGFMGKKWDSTGVAYDVAMWTEVLRVLKPGAHVLAFGGTRTYHRMTCAIEDAGFEIRDCLQWLYGTGFPKSLNLEGGLGTALKPANEPIVMARKPLVGTVAANVGEFGSGALNIDGCRIGFASDVDKATAKPGGRATSKAGGASAATPDAGRGIQRQDFVAEQSALGRWPANVLFDEEAAEQLGGVSRFFYVAKASRSERDAGVCGVQKSGAELVSRKEGSAGLANPRAGAGRTSGGKNTHPTVKPIELMRYLVRLVTPVGGTVLDPFVGSGTTGVAAVLEGRDFVGIEMSEEYAELARQRIAHWHTAA